MVDREFLKKLATRRPNIVGPGPGGYGYLEVRCLGCDTHQTVALDIVRRSKTPPIHEPQRRY